MINKTRFALAIAALALSAVATPSMASVQRLASPFSTVSGSSNAGAQFQIAKSKTSSRPTRLRRSTSVFSRPATSRNTNSSRNQCSADDLMAIRIADEPLRSQLVAKSPECRAAAQDM